MRMSTVVLVAVAIGLAVAIVWFFAPGIQTKEEPTPLVPSARTLPTESGGRASRAPAAAETTAAVPEPTAESTPERGAPVAPAPSPDQYTVTREQMPRSAEEGEQVFSAESVDATWAPGAEANILGRVARVNGLAFNAFQVECRSTMCKLQVAAPNQSSGGGTFDFFNNSLGLQPRWIRIVANNAGSLQWVAYVGREAIPNATDSSSAPPR